MRWPSRSQIAHTPFNVRLVCLTQRENENTARMATDDNYEPGEWAVLDLFDHVLNKGWQVRTSWDPRSCFYHISFTVKPWSVLISGGSSLHNFRTGQPRLALCWWQAGSVIGVGLVAPITAYRGLRSGDLTALRLATALGQSALTGFALSGEHGW